jgi:ribosomal protein S18 acetylase RimI-like enzyme
MSPAAEFEIMQAMHVDDELVEAFARLIPQLSGPDAIPSRAMLREIVEGPATTVLLARHRPSRRIVGTLTLVIFRVPTGVRAWIEDVVVDESMRGRGLGEALTRDAIRRAREQGARGIELTSRPSREAANRLYQRLGFTIRQTNLYHYSP